MSKPELPPLPIGTEVLLHGLRTIAFSDHHMRAYGTLCAAQEREPRNVIRLALMHAAFTAAGGLTCGALRDAAVTLFGEPAVSEAFRSQGETL